MKKKRGFGVLGGSGFLLLIKGVSGLLANIWNRPSSSWRTEISFADVLIYLLLLGGLYYLVDQIASTDSLDKKRLVILLLFLLFATFLVGWIPVFQIPLFSLHPMLLVVAGALLLPAMGNLSFH